jgi:hypothetical protein
MRAIYLCIYLCGFGLYLCIIYVVLDCVRVMFYFGLWFWIVSLYYLCGFGLYFFVFEFWIVFVLCFTLVCGLDCMR